MNGNGLATSVTHKNGNGVGIEKKVVPVKQVTTALIKDDLLDPALGPKPGGISKTKSNLVDVIVRNAVGPHNFVVQDYRQSENLRRLENMMTEFYTEYAKKTPPLEHEEIVPNGYYAARLESQENWVRVHVVKPFDYDNPQIMVFLLDHGSYGMTDAAHLRPLRRMYNEKLPSQAYRAKLHFFGTAGIQWTPEECSRFQADVEGKPFCAIIVDEAKDSMFGDDPIFSLVLIDTSGPQDRYIHQTYLRKR